MKKIKFTIIIFFALALSLFLSACSSIRLNLQSSLYVALPKSVVSTSYKDTHGGFHNDGNTFARLQFDEENGAALLENLNKSDKWFPLPLDPLCSALIFGGEYNGTQLHGLFDSNDVDFDMFPSDIENGMYFFLDRFAQQYPEYENTPIYSRSAYNFTFAIFDSDNNILYFYELDT